MRKLYEVPEPSIEPTEPKQIGRCIHCDGEIYAGDPVYSGENGMLHLECVKDYLMQEMSADVVASKFGYTMEVAQ